MTKKELPRHTQQLPHVRGHVAELPRGHPVRVARPLQAAASVEPLQRLPDDLCGLRPQPHQVLCRAAGEGWQTAAQAGTGWQNLNLMIEHFAASRLGSFKKKAL